MSGYDYSYDLPEVEYDGNINYLDNYHDIDDACSRLYERVSKAKRKGFVPVAFDIEWTPSFRRGVPPGRIALIQVCVDLDQCYLFHVSDFDCYHLPQTLGAFLNHPRVKLVGNNIKADLTKLKKDFPEVYEEEMRDNCIDLGQLYNEARGTPRYRWSLRKLVREILGEELNKDQQIRCSDWDEMPLDQDQMYYAAIDVYVS